MCPLFTSSGTIVHKKTTTPTPYALAAAFTAEDNGAIDPGDNPVAFFTQLSDVFLDDEGIFFSFRVCRACTKKDCGRRAFAGCQLAERILKIFSLGFSKISQIFFERTREGRKVLDNANAFSLHHRAFRVRA